VKEIIRKKLLHGDILEIEILDYGFAYLKYLNIQKFNLNCGYPDLVRIYKGFYAKPIIELKELDRELLIAPITISGRLGIFKVLNIKIICNEEVLIEEEIMPDVKIGYPDDLFGFEIEKYEKMKVMKDMGDTINTYFTTLDKVKHLEWAGATNVRSIPFRILLENLKLQGKDIKEVFGINNFLEEIEYEKTKSMPIYSQLDIKTRDYAFK
jgi:hypothetical protein